MNHLEKAARLVEAARAVKEAYPDATKMPADQAEKMNKCLTQAQKHREAHEADQKIDAFSEYLSDPQRPEGLRDTDEAKGAEDYGIPVLEGDREEVQRKAFFRALRSGTNALTEDERKMLESKDLNQGGSGTSDGSILVPQGVAGPIFKDLPDLTVLRNLSTVLPTSREEIDLRDLTEGSVGWGSLEAGNTAADSAPGADNAILRVQDLVGLAKVGENTLSDTDVNLEAIIRQRVTSQFAEAEDDAFANGDGDASDQPAGIVDGADANQNLDASTVQSISATELTELQYQVPSWARRRGVYLAHSDAERDVMVMTDGDGRFLWEPATADGKPATFRGKPWYSIDGLPTLQTDGTTATKGVVVFGDVNRGYLILDRQQIAVRRLVERYADEGKIGLRFVHRVGGAVMRPKAFATYTV